MSNKLPDQRLIQGLGSLSKLASELSKFKATKTLLVTGKQSFEQNGAKAVIDNLLHADQTVCFSDFAINPKLSDGIKGAKVAGDAGIDAIVAIGGGSVLDMAKIIKALITTKGEPEQIARGQIQVSPSRLTLIAAPTTAGSGSETTHFAVVYIGKDKLSLTSPYLLPDLAILDGERLLSTSPYQRAVNALDALAQAIESYWSVNGTTQSRRYAKKAITMLKQGLDGLLISQDLRHLQKIMAAAHWAGKAINISKTTAPHAFSYAFTSDYNIAHGHAVWMTLPAVFGLHMARAKGRDRTRMRTLCQLLEINRSKDPELQLKKFMRSLDVEPNMENLGVDTNSKRRAVSQRVNRERLSNNPVSLTPADFDQIFNLTDT